MLSVRTIAEEIVAREGGYVNDPDDPGGATNYGVTIRTMRELGLDLDGDGDVDTVDVRALPRAKAIEVFIDRYYRRARLEQLPETLQPAVFDMNVNSGTNAIRILQRLLGLMGENVAVDGALGPKTAAAAAAAAAAAPGHIVDAYGIARRNWYYSLADGRPPLRKFACRRDGGKGGWIVRAEEFITPRYRLTDAQHRTRTRTWA